MAKNGGSKSVGAGQGSRVPAKLMSAAESGRLKLSRGVSRLVRALAADPDLVKVRVRKFDYLVREVGRDGEQNPGQDTVWRDENELAYMRVYGANGELRYKHSDQVLDTSAMHSKRGQSYGNAFKGFAAFALAKDGTLYMEEWGKLAPGRAQLVHGSFQNDAPLNMAGLLRVERGKITAINDHSGHYAPEPLDMYRGIRALEARYPGIFDPHAVISFHMGVWSPQRQSVRNFVATMERGNPPHHQVLREARVASLQQENQLISNARSVVIDLTTKPLLEFVKELNNDALAFAKLYKALQSPLSHFSIQELGGVRKLTYGQFLGYVMSLPNHQEIMGHLMKAGLNPNRSTSHLADTNHDPAPDKMGDEYKKNQKASGLTTSYSPAMSDKDLYGASPFLIAASTGSPVVLRQMVDKGANIKQTTELGLNALHVAASAGRTENIRYLLQAGADANVKGASEGRTPLIIAVATGNLEAAKLLAANQRSLVDLADNSGDTALQHAVRAHDAEMAAMLIDHGADVNQVDNRLMTALHCAVAYSDIKMLDALMDRGANSSFKDDTGHTPLEYAIFGKKMDSAEVLVRRGAYIGGPGKCRELLLDVVADNNISGAALLLSCPSFAASPQDMSAILEDVLFEGKYAMAKLLLDYGASPDLADHERKNMLHIFAERGNVGAVRILLDNFANFDMSSRDNFGFTALDYAHANGHKELAAMLADAESLALRAQPDVIAELGTGSPQTDDISLADYYFNTADDLAIMSDMLADTINDGDYVGAATLLAAGAPIEIPGENRNWLHVFAELGDLEGTRAVLANSPALDLAQADAAGLSALHIAKKHKHTDLVQELEEELQRRSPASRVSDNEMMRDLFGSSVAQAAVDALRKTGVQVDDNEGLGAMPNALGGASTPPVIGGKRGRS